ncbi:DUF1542 domain-containing protein [Lactobacillus panisapium]|uniref:DUF1542 domain-containing protein n=1 Tax=Lactobacillus panisapium TaxID=2012495 RepID=A0ABX8WEL7_9LACO|nr:DUF1542 domain-containing protein [Lactobacillus panisapium]QYN53566.1 DUF1542 domain-containing protein [Lactobacillus panisapium]
MNKNNSYKKVIVSLSGAALLTVGLSQMPNNVLNNTPVQVSAAKKSKVIGANSAIYRLKGKKMVKTGTVLKVGKKVSVSSKKTVKGKVYYKIGKNQYIKAVNVDGKSRNTAKKTVLYTRKGKAIKSSKIAKGQKVTIYGAAVTIKGKKYYSTKLGYIKASALAKKEPAIDNNDVEKPNENTTTPTDKPDSGNNTASTNNSNSTSVPSTGGSSSTSPSVPTVDPALQPAKDDAVKDIKKAQDDAVNLVKSSPLTDDEKQTAINQIEDIVKAALGEQKDGKSGSINDAKTVADVKKAKDEATAKCELVGNQIVSNDLAKQEGDFVTKAVAKMDDGDAKTAAPDKIAKAVKDAKDAITSAKSQADLDKAEADFQNALNDAVPFAKQQEYAIDTINNAVKTAKDEINNDDWMSEDEKNATLSEIDTVVKLALGEKKDGTSGDVHDATTTSDIFTAMNTVLATCRAKQISDSLKKKQEAAIESINAKATEAKNKIDDNKNLAKAQQDKAKEDIDKAVKDATDEKTGTVNAAKTADDVTKAENAATNAINDAVNKANDEANKNLLDAKNKAVGKIKDMAKEAQDKIAGNKNLTEEQQKIAIDKITELVDKATDEKTGTVNAAKTTDDVTTAENNATDAINNTVKDTDATADKNLQDAKDKAVGKIKDAAKEAQDKIAGNKNLTDEQQSKAKEDIDKAVKDATDEKTGAVNAAKTIDDVTTAENAATSAINKAVKDAKDESDKSLQDAKDTAVKEIKETQDDVVNSIKSSPLTDDEKQTAVNQIEDIVKAALGEQKDGKSGAINDTKTVADVKKVVDETKAKCELVGNQIVSNDLVKQEGDFVKDAVAKMDDGDAKTVAPDKIAKAVKAANDAIASAKSQADLDKAETDFQNALNDVVPFAKQQEYAKDTINSAVTDAKAAINNDTTLSKDEKDEALSEIDAVSNAALVAHKDDTNDGDNVSHNIYDAKTTSDILSSVNMVLATCKARQTDSSLKEQKDGAIKEINQAADDAIQAVTDTPASTENKRAAVDRINAIVKNALGEQKDGLTGDIHDAMSEDEINTIKEQVTKACKFEGKKLASSELVSQVSDFASKSVAKMDDGDAKTAAPDKIAKAAKTAKDAITSAKSQAELDKAETDFQNALNDAVPFAKQQAYTVDSINNAVKTAKDKINNDGLLTDSDKKEKLAQIDAVVKAALGDQKDGTSGDVHDATTTNDLLLAQNSVITVCNQI